MRCDFLPTLKMLQKHSAQSVDDANDKISDYSRYLHVDRPMQDDLVSLIEREANADRKSLILLCGSAGDGKSHLLSYLKHIDTEGSLAKFAIRNDATESDAPSRTAPETLATALTPYDDGHLNDGGREKMIVAINLGLLGRFIESDISGNYSLFKKYVDETRLLKSELSDDSYDPHSAFHAINFSDYQVFTLVDGQCETAFLKEIISKITRDEDDNPFSVAYNSACTNCICSSYCPVRHNYEFLRIANLQSSIASLIVEASLANNHVVTARESLNFIYNVLVSPAFSKDILAEMNSGNPNDFLDYYLRNTMSFLMFETSYNGGIDACVSQLDVLCSESQDVDELAIRFRSSPRLYRELLPGIAETPYYPTLLSDEYVKPEALRGPKADTLQQELFNFLIRTAYLNGTSIAINDSNAIGVHVNEFSKFLYAFNTGKKKDTKQLRSLLDKAIEDWDGDYPSGYSLIDSYDDVLVLQRIELHQATKDPPKVYEDSELTKFRPYIILHVTLKNSPGSEGVDFRIDYRLYRLLLKMSKGYQPTLMDKNTFSGFQTSYDKLLSQGNRGSEIFLARRSSGKKPYMRMWIDDDDEVCAEVIQ